MKIPLLLILALNTLLTVFQDIPVNPARGEFYIITEAYVIIDDSIYTMQDEFVDVTSKVFMMFNDDSTTIITVDQGTDSVVFVGYATEVDDEGIYDFLKGRKTVYEWTCHSIYWEKTIVGLVVREYLSGIEEMIPYEYYRFHLLFEERQYILYCNLPEYVFLKPEKE
jgi:hypothetical protein